ncbi:MAG: hypothetical protein IJZ53_02285 [Tyzzerella sp.]|nr:hypothetical protein [Tyzzerella sp.]
MTNIWSFLNQTLSVTLIAVCILFVKWMLQDKLSPRWQYGVWAVLAARILLPVNITRHIVLPIPVWLEMAKAMVEKQLTSAFTEIYVPAKVKHIIPIMAGTPSSVTDWIFVVYIVGMVISVLWYLISYLKLRRVLRRGTSISDELKIKIQNVCEKYELKTCKTIMIDGLPSAFVCGGLQPTLVLPADREVDEKVILHELLHLKYHDELQSAGWCMLRCLHWCNPLLQYVFYRIENDMEALCDQRVLERLEGGERRDYGIILLDMANEKYARVPGTSSISNGGKNITRRITSIVRFKKYPEGMALVSVCCVIIIMVFALFGSGRREYSAYWNPYHPGPLYELDESMAYARLDRCSTMAGALDTYAKGLAYENGLYIAIASPYDKHDELEATMRQYAEEDGWRANYLYSGAELEYLTDGAGYGIYNIRKCEDGSYLAYLRFSIYSLLKEDGTPWPTEMEEDPSRGGYVLVPVSVWYEDGWIVEEKGERIVLTFSESLSLYEYTDLIPEKAEFAATGERGTIKIKVQTEHHIGKFRASARSSNLGDSLDLDAEFEDERPQYEVEYTYTADAEGNSPEEYVGIQIAEMSSLDEKVDFRDWKNLSGVGHDSEGFTWIMKAANNEENTLNGLSETGDLYFDKILEGLPVAYKAQIYWDGEVVEELLLEEVYAK